MSAYVIVEIEIVDPIGYEEYKKQAASTVHSHGGKYIVRGGTTEVLEGDWNPARFVIIEFPSVEKAKAWWDSSSYAEAKALRRATANTQMIVVEGVEDP